MHLFRLLALIIILSGLFNAAYAQKPTDLKREGEKAFDQERWATAFSLLSQYQQLKPGDLGVLTRLGALYYHLHQAEKARQHLEYVTGQPEGGKMPEAQYYLALTLHGMQEYDRAIAAYKNFLRTAPEKHPKRALVQDNIRRASAALGIGPNPQVALVENLGNRVNTAGDEFAPVQSPTKPERLYFSAARETSTGGRRNNEGYADSLKGKLCSDMYFARQTTTGWEAGIPVSGLLNSPRNEVVLDFGDDGRVLYFFRGFTLFGGDIFTDTLNVADEYTLDPPPVQLPLQPEAGDDALYFFDNNTILFASRRTGGLGGLDLYITQRSDSGWTTPQNLGPSINSPYDETTPFLAHDGRTLYFSSNRNSGMGGLDVYRAIFEDAKQSWTEANNLGIPVNSAADDAYFRLTPDGKNAFFASNRLDSYGERDIYLAYYKDAQIEQNSRSRPALFTEVGKADPQAGGQADTDPGALIPLFYNTDRDLQAPENQPVLDRAAAFFRANPEATLVITAFTDETGPAKFDLYYGIRRAEVVAKALTDRGVPTEKMLLRSAGAAYALAPNTQNGAPYLLGQRLNRRVEVGFTHPEQRLDARVARPPAQTTTDTPADLDARLAGLSFRVEAVSARQILNTETYYTFPDLMIESLPGTGNYRYLTGLHRKYQAALTQRNELRRQGFTDAAVVAYINGLMITKAEAVAWLRKYPELAAYVRG